MVCALRSLLRFLHVQGWIASPLASAVPSIPRRREDLPRGLAAGHVQRLLDGCDRATSVGRRDFAILTLLSRLGLRRGEVAGLRLDDVDWRTGEIVIHGKGSRIDRLPLPRDVGEALVGYLRSGRPRGFGRALFRRSCAPIAGVSSAAVSSVVVRACERAGIPPVGAHALRHTLAAELLRRGAALPEIGQVLRHRSLETTFRAQYRPLSQTLGSAWFWQRSARTRGAGLGRHLIASPLTTTQSPTSAGRPRGRSARALAAVKGSFAIQPRGAWLIWRVESHAGAAISRKRARGSRRASVLSGPRQCPWPEATGRGRTVSESHLIRASDPIEAGRLRLYGDARRASRSFSSRLASEPHTAERLFQRRG
jgi:hypothetical protein